MNHRILDMVRNRRIISFYYDGLPRIVEPHAYGLTKTDREAIRAYQTGGRSVSGSIPGWRLFLLDEMSPPRDTGRSFVGTRPGYSRGDEGLPTIFCEL